jgi:hypothetical protein
MTEVRFLLVGLGARSRIWRQVLDVEARARIVGLVETDPTRLAAALAERPGMLGGSSVAEVASRVEADAVILVTPPAGRHAQITEAAAARLAILAEKPLADSLAEAEAHVATAAAAGVPLMVGLNFRYLAVTRALRSLFAADRLGAPAFGRFTYERWRDGRLPHLNRYPLTMDHPMLGSSRSITSTSCASSMAPSPWASPRGPGTRPGRCIAVTRTSRRSSPSRGHRGHLPGTWAGNCNWLDFNWRTDCDNGIAVQADMFGALSFARRDDPAMTSVDLPSHRDLARRRSGAPRRRFCHLLDGAPLPCSGADHLNSLRMVEAAIRSAEPTNAEPG